MTAELGRILWSRQEGKEGGGMKKRILTVLCALLFGISAIPIGPIDR